MLVARTHNGAREYGTHTEPHSTFWLLNTLTWSLGILTIEPILLPLRAPSNTRTSPHTLTRTTIARLHLPAACVCVSLPLNALSICNVAVVATQTCAFQAADNRQNSPTIVFNEWNEPNQPEKWKATDELSVCQPNRTTGFFSLDVFLFFFFSSSSSRLWWPNGPAKTEFIRKRHYSIISINLIE